MEKLIDERLNSSPSVCQAAVLLEQERQEMVQMVGPQGMVSTIGGKRALLFFCLSFLTT